MLGHEHIPLLFSEDGTQDRQTKQRQNDSRKIHWNQLRKNLEDHTKAV